MRIPVSAIAVFLLLNICVPLCSGANETGPISGKVEPIEGGTSPNGMFQVVDVLLTSTDSTGYVDGEWHFEIRSKDGKTLVSEFSQTDLVLSDDGAKYTFAGAETVLWRGNSKWVAISTRTSKFNVETLVFHWNKNNFERIAIPEYEADSGDTFRLPDHWLRNGALVLDITYPHVTKSEPGGSEYYATVGFSGNPPKGFKRSRTKTIIDE